MLTAAFPRPYSLLFQRLDPLRLRDSMECDGGKMIASRAGGLPFYGIGIDPKEKARTERAFSLVWFVVLIGQ